MKNTASIIKDNQPSAERVDRVVFIRAPRRLSPEQITAALGGMAEDDPRWLAFHQLLDEELASAVLDVSAPAAQDRGHAAGRIESLATLRARIAAAARRPAA